MHRTPSIQILDPFNWLNASWPTRGTRVLILRLVDVEEMHVVLFFPSLSGHLSIVFQSGLTSTSCTYTITVKWMAYDTTVIPSNGRQAWGLRPDDEHLQLSVRSFGPWPSICTTQPHTAILPTPGGLGHSLWIRYSRIPRTGQESHPDFYEILVLDASWGLSFDAS